MQRVTWRGVFPALCTQFHADLTLDIPGYEGRELLLIAFLVIVVPMVFRDRDDHWSPLLLRARAGTGVRAVAGRVPPGGAPRGAARAAGLAAGRLDPADRPGVGGTRHPAGLTGQSLPARPGTRIPYWAILR